MRDVERNSATDGHAFLAKWAGEHLSIASTGYQFSDNFSQLLMLDIGFSRKLLNIKHHAKAWNYFVGTKPFIYRSSFIHYDTSMLTSLSGKPVLTTESYPDDFDTTALAWTVIPGSHEVARSILDEMVLCVDERGVTSTYFDRSRIRTDPVVCINVLHMAYYYNYHDSLLRPSLDFVIEYLKELTYLSGTRYYPSPDAFLYFFSRMLMCHNASSLRDELLPLIQQRILERAGHTGDSMSLDMRLLAALTTRAGVENGGEVWQGDLAELKRLQRADGGWELGWLWSDGRKQGIVYCFCFAGYRKL